MVVHLSTATIFVPSCNGLRAYFLCSSVFSVSCWCSDIFHIFSPCILCNLCYITCCRPQFLSMFLVNTAYVNLFKIVPAYWNTMKAYFYLRIPLISLSVTSFPLPLKCFLNIWTTAFVRITFHISYSECLFSVIITYYLSLYIFLLRLVNFHTFTKTFINFCLHCYVKRVMAISP